MLNLSSGSGSGNYIRFSPQANMWTNNNNEEIQLKKVVFDIDNIRTVVPEPATGTLFGLSAIALGMVARRRR